MGERGVEMGLTCLVMRRRLGSGGGVVCLGFIPSPTHPQVDTLFIRHDRVRELQADSTLNSTAGQRIYQIFGDVTSQEREAKEFHRMQAWGGKYQAFKVSWDTPQ